MKIITCIKKIVLLAAIGLPTLLWANVGSSAGSESLSNPEELQTDMTLRVENQTGSRLIVTPITGGNIKFYGRWDFTIFVSGPFSLPAKVIEPGENVQIRGVYLGREDQIDATIRICTLPAGTFPARSNCASLQQNYCQAHLRTHTMTLSYFARNQSSPGVANLTCQWSGDGNNRRRSSFVVRLHQPPVDMVTKTGIVRLTPTHHHYNNSNKYYSHFDVRSTHADKDKTIYIATANGIGLINPPASIAFHPNGQNGLQENVPSSPVISIRGDGRGQLFAGTFSNDLYRGIKSNDNSLKFEKDKAFSLQFNSFMVSSIGIYSLSQTLDQVYIAGTRGLWTASCPIQADCNTWTPLLDEGQIYEVTVATLPGSDQPFIFTSAHNGLRVFHRTLQGDHVPVNVPTAIANQFIHHVHVAQNGLVYVAVNGQGIAILKLENNQFILAKMLTEKDDNLPNNRVTHISTSATGTLYLTTYADIISIGFPIGEYKYNWHNREDLPRDLGIIATFVPNL